MSLIQPVYAFNAALEISVFQCCGKCLFCMKTKSKCECSDEVKVRLVTIISDISKKMFSLENPEMFCMVGATSAGRNIKRNTRGWLGE